MKPQYWIIILIFLAIIGFGGYKLWHHFNAQSMLHNVQKTAMVNAVPSPSTSVTNTTNSGGLPNKSDTSNQQLNQDLQNIQNSMNQLQQDQNTSNQDVSTQSQDTPQQ